MTPRDRARQVVNAWDGFRNDRGLVVAIEKAIEAAQAEISCPKCGGPSFAEACAAYVEHKKAKACRKAYMRGWCEGERVGAEL